MAIEAKNLGRLPLPPRLTCRYDLNVEESELRRGVGWTDALDQTLDSPSGTRHWSGKGRGQAYYGQAEGLVGTHPRFELFAGWLALFPTAGWTQSMPLCCFSGFEHLDDLDQMRDLKSYSVFLGEALQDVLQLGDTFTLSRNRVGDFSYTLRRGSLVILRAGSVAEFDEGGALAAWQEYDQFVARPYVTVRAEGHIFHLVDGQDVHVDQYYIFGARTAQKPRGLGFVPLQAICSAGALSHCGEDLIRDAAYQLTMPKIRVS